MKKLFRTYLPTVYVISELLEINADVYYFTSCRFCLFTSEATTRVMEKRHE